MLHAGEVRDCGPRNNGVTGLTQPGCVSLATISHSLPGGGGRLLGGGGVLVWELVQTGCGAVEGVSGFCSLQQVSQTQVQKAEVEHWWMQKTAGRLIQLLRLLSPFSSFHPDTHAVT